MKNTKSAGLVSCNFEAYIISKINNDLERKKAKRIKRIKTKRGQRNSESD